MSQNEFRKINVPLGATIRITRTDGSNATYIFHGSDPQGGIFEDDSGKRHGDIGEYSKLEIKTDHGWSTI